MNAEPGDAELSNVEFVGVKVLDSAFVDADLEAGLVTDTFLSSTIENVNAELVNVEFVGVKVLDSEFVDGDPEAGLVTDAFLLSTVENVNAELVIAELINTELMNAEFIGVKVLDSGFVDADPEACLVTDARLLSTVFDTSGSVIFLGSSSGEGWSYGGGSSSGSPPPSIRPPGNPGGPVSSPPPPPLSE